MIAYKLFYVEHEASYIESYTMFVGTGGIMYDKRTTRPDRFGPMACFTSLTHLMDFASDKCRQSPQIRAYKVKIKKSKCKYLYNPWHDRRPHLRIDKLPEGTVLADTVTLLEEVLFD